MPGELLASRVGGRLWAAVREQGSTVELRIEPAGPGPGAGCIVKARIGEVVESLGAAFADVGAERAAFLPARDLPRLAGALGRAPLRDRLRAGQDLLVQVEREGRGSKGPRVTARLTLAGRRLVLVSDLTRCTVSRRIDDPAERSRLRQALERLPRPDVGWIARAAAQGVEEPRIAADAARLLDLWRDVRSRGASAPAPSTVLPEPGLLEELLRDAPAGGFDRVVVDGDEDRRRAIAYLEAHDPAAVARVALHAGSPSLFRSTGVEGEIERALRPRVWLPSGGYLVIEETEALVSVDVNSGKHVERGEDGEATALATNLEAARELPRQLRLRGLGGLVVVDLIDLVRRESREKVLAAFRAALSADPARTRLAGPNEVGLLALTREAPRPGIAARLTRACEACRGTGRVRA